MTARATAAVNPAFSLKAVSLRGWHIAAIHAVLIAVVLAPMAMAQYPPLVDYPNHLARIHILSTLADDPVLREIYAANWSIIPNLAMDGLLVPLAKLLPIHLLGRLFVVLTMAMFIGGAYALHRVIHGRTGLWPAVILLFVYNQVLAWGFLNYLFGAGLTLFAFAGWIWLRERWRWGPRIAMFSIVAVALFFSHMLAFGVYALLIGGYELGRSLHCREQPWRMHVADWGRAGAQFVIPAVLWLISTTGTGGGPTTFGGVWSKISAIASMTVFQDPAVGVASFFFVLVLVAGGVFTRSFRLQPAMAAPLIVLAIATLVMPVWLFGSWAVDIRLSPVLAAVAVASVRFERRRRMFADVMLMIGMTLMVMKLYAIASMVPHHDRRVAELRAAVAESIPKGAALLNAVSFPYYDPAVKPGLSQINFHLAAYTVIDRSLFLPILFTDPEKQPLIVTPRYRFMDTPFDHPMPLSDLRRGADPAWADRMFARRDERGRTYYWAYWPKLFDYLLVYDWGKHENPMPRYLNSVRKGSYFAIYKIVKPG